MFLYDSKKHKKRRMYRLISLFFIIAIPLGGFFGSKLLSTRDASTPSKKSQAVEEKKEKSSHKKENISQNTEKAEEKPVVNPISHKPGTSHNYEADAWSYSIQDVNNWILNPSSYTGTDKLVFLTFDDGPSVEHTGTVLDILKNYGVHATFFIVGRSADLDTSKPLLERELTEGHAIGLHSYTHEYSYLYPGRVANVQNILEEVDKNMAALQKHLGEDFSTTILRYPGGHMSWKSMAPADEALAQRNIHNIDWNVLTGDAVGTNDPKFHQTAFESVQSDMQMYGNPKVVVILMHDVKEKSVIGLPQIIEYYASMGYKFGILS